LEVKNLVNEKKFPPPSQFFRDKNYGKYGIRFFRQQFLSRIFPRCVFGAAYSAACTYAAFFFFSFLPFSSNITNIYIANRAYLYSRAVVFVWRCDANGADKDRETRRMATLAKRERGYQFTIIVDQDAPYNNVRENINSAILQFRVHVVNCFPDQRSRRG